MPSRRVLLNSVAAVLLLSLVGPGTALSEGAIPVVATFSILGDMVQRIGGESVAARLRTSTSRRPPMRGPSATPGSSSSTGWSSKAGWTG